MNDVLRFVWILVGVLFAIVLAPRAIEVAAPTVRRVRGWLRAHHFPTARETLEAVAPPLGELFRGALVIVGLGLGLAILVALGIGIERVLRRLGFVS